MTSLKLDLVFLFANPVIREPLESLHLKLLESLLKHILRHGSVSGYEISFVRLRFLSQRQLLAAFETIEGVCKLLGVAPSEVALKFEEEDLLVFPEERPVRPLVRPSYRVTPKSEFEREMCNVFIPLLKYKHIFDSFDLEGYTGLLLCGNNSGNVFIDWFRSLQEALNTDPEGNECSRTLQLSVIRFSEILMPYFGESEQKLRFLFESSVDNARDGVLCICLEGLHNFSNSKECSDDLERRILSTLLLLLDGINRKSPSLDSAVVVVATTEEDPDTLDEALLRPGRLYRILQVVES